MTTPATHTATYTIPAECVPQAQAIVERANKRAARLGVPAFTIAHTLRMEKRHTPAQLARIEALGTDLPTFPDELTPTLVEVADVTVTGPALRAPGGWTFGATVEVLDYDETTGRPLSIVSGPRSADCADLREAAPVCEHCHAARRRLQTFALFAEDGRRVVVGSSCLTDFLGGHNPAAEVGCLGLWRVIAGGFDDEAMSLGGARRLAWSVKAVLDVACAFIAQAGYVSRAMERDNPAGGQATASMVGLFLTSDKFRRECGLEVRDGDKAAADTVAAEWAAVAERVDAARAAGSEVSDWDWKLYLMHRTGTIAERQLGVAVGACKGTLGALTSQAAAKLGAGGFLGTVGERIPFRLAVDGVKVFDGGDYGPRMLVLGHVDGTADRVCYWTAAGGKVEFTQGAVLDVKGTIKAHEDDARYGKRTVVQRLSLHTPKPPKAPKVPKAAPAPAGEGQA